MASQQYNSGEHIDDIINRYACDDCKVPHGTPCFSVRYGNGKGERGPAVCGKRIRRAGFNGKIHPSSLSRSVTKNQPSPRR